MKVQGFRGKYYFLSNMSYFPVVIGGIKYPTRENAYQAQKTLDVEDRRRFMRCSPVEAHKLGKKLSLRKDWEDIKVSAMYNVVRACVEQNPRLRHSLLDTWCVFLEETNTWGDYFWGVCRNKGENNLGKILMRIRYELKEKDDEV